MAPKKKRSTAQKSKTTRSKKRAAPKKRTKVARKRSAKGTLQGRLDQVNRVINRFEGEVETLVKRLVKQGERSRKDLKKNFDEILKKVQAGKILARVGETREELEKDVRRVAEEVLGTVKDVESIINREKMSGILSNARSSIENLVEVLRENGLVLQAKQTVANTRREVLGFFSIPTQGDVEKLERKIVNLEKRLSNLTRKAA